MKPQKQISYNLKTQLLLSGLVAFLFSINGLAQNTNVKVETKTTTTTKTDSEGDHTTVKKETTKEVQNIELEKERPNTLNIPMKDSPVTVTTSTKITNPDGTTRTVNIDRSGYYVSNEKKYKLNLDAQGYTISNDNSKPALLRFTSTNSYVYRSKNRTSVGYFDTNNDLILETYDDKSDKVTLEKFIIVK
jgi:hypothetical protein